MSQFILVSTFTFSPWRFLNGNDSAKHHRGLVLLGCEPAVAVNLLQVWRWAAAARPCPLSAAPPTSRPWWGQKGRDQPPLGQAAREPHTLFPASFWWGQYVPTTLTSLKLCHSLCFLGCEVLVGRAVLSVSIVGPFMVWIWNPPSPSHDCHVFRGEAFGKWWGMGFWPHQRMNPLMAEWSTWRWKLVGGIRTLGSCHGRLLFSLAFPLYFPAVRSWQSSSTVPFYHDALLQLRPKAMEPAHNRPWSWNHGAQHGVGCMAES